MKDLRLSEFNNYNEEMQMALIRLGIFHMLKMSGLPKLTFRCNIILKKIPEVLFICGSGKLVLKLI